jgi:hypothetical protein
MLSEISNDFELDVIVDATLSSSLKLMFPLLKLEALESK